MNGPSEEPRASRSPEDDLNERILRIAAAIGRHLARQELARRAGATGVAEIGDAPLEGQEE